MRKFLLCLLISSTLIASYSQAVYTPKKEYRVELITADQLKDYLTFVASDEMEGRSTPSKGLNITAKFIATLLSRWGVKPAGDNGTYFQTFTINDGKEQAKTQNVIGMIPGSDPKLKEEYVAVSAHYDHVGVGKGSGDVIYNGADDDGSGTVAVLAIAEAMAHADVKPRRSVLFIWHAGEERGLWGSRHFTESPTIPLNQITGLLNIDMIGRSKQNGDPKPANTNLSGPSEIYVIGSKRISPAFGDFIAQVNDRYLRLTFNYKYDDPNDPEHFFERSDHYMYALKNIPIAFYFSGVHEDYHQPGDEVQKIDFGKMERVARTIYLTLWELANSPQRIK